MKPRVAVIGGDGVGPEVISKALEEASGRFDVVTIDAGADRFLSTGELLTVEDLETIAACDALLLGAVGDPRVPQGVLEQGILLRIRREFDFYVNLRPLPELGIVLVRENTEGVYAGVGWRSINGAYEVSVNTREVVKRCLRFAFQLAETRSGHLTWIHKTNVLAHAGALWRDAIAEVRRDHASVDVHYEHVDAAAYHLVTDPSRFDVIVTDNLFGDILSDLGAAMAGGIGLAASANLHINSATRRGRCVGMFEPIHGSAPDIAGLGIADPTGAIRATEMMLEWAKSGDEAAIFDGAP